mmetsp:Transcript_17790/g.24512  ORF Transcript_17790/g.24512 Transcript_17790/m.24512 type:complete len:94 (-) Transcript_17790:2-283(-)
MRIFLFLLLIIKRHHRAIFFYREDNRILTTHGGQLLVLMSKEDIDNVGHEVTDLTVSVFLRYFCVENLRMSCSDCGSVLALRFSLIGSILSRA